MTQAATLNTTDTDMQLFKEASDLAFIIGVKYRRASFADKAEMRDEVDSYFDAFSLARHKLFKDGVITTAKDVDDMKKIREAVQSDINTQKRIGFILKGVQLLAGLIL